MHDKVITRREGMPCQVPAVRYGCAGWCLALGLVDTRVLDNRPTEARAASAHALATFLFTSEAQVDS